MTIIAQKATARQSCRGCGRTKLLADFPRNAKSRTGFSRRCEDCLEESRALAAKKRSKTASAKKDLNLKEQIRKQPRKTLLMSDRAKFLLLRLEIHALDNLDTPALHLISDLRSELNFNEGRS